MGWFNKKEEKGKKDEIPALPKLPKLPELPKLGEKEDYSLKPIHQLPSFPTNSLGEKFSQNTIKEAITGRKEGEDVLEEDNLEEFQGHLKKSSTKEVPFLKRGEKIPERFETRKVIKTEPIFIRIDKFEEALHVFEKIKEKISEVEKMLKDIKRIKEDEEKELDFWENEIQVMKEQIEKVDKDIFSKIE
jgi:hypothetical protein